MIKANVIVICGPTALGKTAVAIDLAKSFGAEIIGADSMQIYRYMDIGTAKPNPGEQAAVPHYMIDIVDPDEPFDAKQFAKKAREKIFALHDRRVVPFVVGGTGFYIKALVHGLFSDVPSNPDIRRRLKEEGEIRGIESLYSRLRKCDPESAKTLHPNDAYRITRALEVYESAGKRLSEYHREHGFMDMPFNVLKIGLNMNRDLLYDRINQRVDRMIDAGLLDEVKGLLNMGYGADLKSMQSIGYRHMVDFIQNRCSWNEALRTFKRDTRRYAKRQLTWFKADSEIKWSKPNQINDIRQMIKKFLQAD